MSVLAVPLQPIEFKDFSLWAVEKARAVQSFTATVLNKHTDLVSSLQILAITTCLLASKLFEGVPVILTRVSLVALNYTGIVSLNVQVKDLLKSCEDCVFGIKHRQWTQVVETAAKVLCKGVNVLLTAVFFGTSLLALAGYPGAVLTAALALRPLSLLVLGVKIISDLRDYIVNETVLKKIVKIEGGEDFRGRIEKVMLRFLARIKGTDSAEESAKESFLADKMVYQLDWLTLETFKERLIGLKESENRHAETLKVFYAVRDSVQSGQTATRSNISLTTLGYLAMGLCKMFPDSLTEMASRWSMSVLYTEELIRQKLFQRGLDKQLQEAVAE